MSITGIIFGIVLLGVGVLTLKFNSSFANTLGTPGFIQRLMGYSAGYSFYKLISVLIILIGFIVMFGGFGLITNLILAPFRNLIRS